MGPAPAAARGAWLAALAPGPSWEGAAAGDPPWPGCLGVSWAARVALQGAKGSVSIAGPPRLTLPGALFALEETHPASNTHAGKCPKPALLKVLWVVLPCWKLLRTLSKHRDLRCWYNRKKVSNAAIIMSRKVPRKNTTAEQQENRGSSG